MQGSKHLKNLIRICDFVVLGILMFRYNGNIQTLSEICVFTITVQLISRALIDSFLSSIRVQTDKILIYAKLSAFEAAEV